MWRVPYKICRCNRHKLLSVIELQCQHQSTHPGGSGGVSGAVKATVAGGVTAAALGGTLAYATWSTENRKSIEETIPGANYVLDLFLGPPVESPPAVPPKTTSHFLEKKLEREKQKSIQEVPKPPVSSVAPAVTKSSAEKKLPPSLPEHEQPADGATKVKEKEEPPKQDQSTQNAVGLASRLAAGEAAEASANASLTKLLEECILSAQKDVSAAILAAQDAARAVRRHAETALRAVDSGLDQSIAHSAIAELSKARAELVKAAESKAEDAQNCIEKLQDHLRKGYENVMTKHNPSLALADQVLAELSTSLKQVKNIVSEALRESSVVSEFKEMIENSRKEFEHEIQSLMPEVKLGEKSKKLTEEELNLLLAHAHRKVMALQKALAKQQTLEKDKYKDSVQRQRIEEAKVQESRLALELEKQKQQMLQETKQQLGQLREDMETELRGQLKRQAAAHSEHLADVLAVQEKELSDKWLEKLRDELQSERDKYYSSLASMKGDLEGLKAALTSRASVDKAAYAAHELWLACQSLRTALRLGREDAHSWEEQLLPLDKRVAAIRAAAGEKNTFIESVLGSFPSEALERGVYTEEALRERFLKVDSICRRVSMIGDTGGSLMKYMLSYLQSTFIISSFDQLPSKEVRNEEIPVDQLTTYEVLNRAKYCLQKDDLVQAVRYMNLLRGEPRHVASDWIKEARLALEARQAAEALMAHAAATAVKAL